jgi:hypothetical protein
MNELEEQWGGNQTGNNKIKLLNGIRKARVLELFTSLEY